MANGGMFTMRGEGMEDKLRALVAEWRQLASKAKPIRERLSADERHWLDTCADQLEAVLDAKDANG